MDHQLNWGLYSHLKHPWEAREKSSPNIQKTNGKQWTKKITLRYNSRDWGGGGGTNFTKRIIDIDNGLSPFEFATSYGY